MRRASRRSAFRSAFTARVKLNVIRRQRMRRSYRRRRCKGISCLAGGRSQCSAYIVCTTLYLSALYTAKESERCCTLYAVARYNGHVVCCQNNCSNIAIRKLSTICCLYYHIQGQNESCSSNCSICLPLPIVFNTYNVIHCYVTYRLILLHTRITYLLTYVISKHKCTEFS